MDTPSKLRVLIVDDSAAMRSLIKTILQSHFSVSRIHEAGDAAQALEIFLKTEIDLILTDIVMEPEDGLSLVRKVRSQGTPAQRQVPIIAVTGYSTRTMVETLRDLGVHEVLTKPVTIRALSDRIRSVFENPREFVEGGDFVGPDRRRRDAAHMGPERRGLLNLDDEVASDDDAA